MADCSISSTTHNLVFLEEGMGKESTRKVGNGPQALFGFLVRVLMHGPGFCGLREPLIMRGGQGACLFMSVRLKH